MPAAMVKRHNALVRKLLHSIEGQTSREGLLVTGQDIASDACFAKNDMLEIGGVHPITAVLGIQLIIIQVSRIQLSAFDMFF